MLEARSLGAVADAGAVEPKFGPIGVRKSRIRSALHPTRPPHHVRKADDGPLGRRVTSSLPRSKGMTGPRLFGTNGFKEN